MVSPRAGMRKKEKTSRIPKIPAWAAKGLAVGSLLVVLAVLVMHLLGGGKGGVSSSDRAAYLKLAAMPGHDPDVGGTGKQPSPTGPMRVADRKKAEDGMKPAAKEPPKPALPPKFPPLPQDYKQWKDADFLVARFSGDPRLPAALDHRLQHWPHDEPQAVFLKNLLAPTRPASGKAPVAGAMQTAASRPLPLPVLTVIAKGLAENPTRAARQAIADLLAGALGQQNDQVAVHETLKALADHPSDNNDAVLFAALTQPDVIRLAGQGRLTPEALQKLAFRVVQEDGESGIRVRVAERFADPACPQELRKLMTPLVEQKCPENLEAQAILFQGKRMEPKIAVLLEKQLLAYSYDTLVQAFGLAVEQAVGGADQAGPDPNADPEWLARAARLLWSDEVTSVLNERQVAMDSLDEDPNTLLFAATIPTREARSRLARTLARHWEETPKALTSAGWGKTVLSEPGMLAVLKTVRASETSKDRGQTKPAAVVSRYTTRRGNALKKALAVRKSQPGPEDAWLAAEETLVREYCRRLLAAGLAEAHARRESARADAPENGPPPPIPLDPGASALVSYRARWPGTDAKERTDATRDSTEVSYVRVEETAIPRAVLAHYERTVKRFHLHRLTDGVWLDSLLPADEDGRCRSIDVLLTRANAKSETPPEKRQELTVEILVVNLPALRTGLKMTAQAPAESDPDERP